MSQRRKKAGWNSLKPTRSSMVTRPAAALAAAAAIAAGTQAYGYPLRFENPLGPGRFEWRGPLGTETWLDIAKAASEQTGLLSGPASIGQLEAAGFGRLFGDWPTLAMEVGGYADLFVAPIFSGELVPTGAPWSTHAYTYYEGYGSALPEGQCVYLGVRFDPGDGIHYGAVGVVRDGTGLEPYVWGYETRVNTPYVPFPEPGALALLAFGAVAALRRRRAPSEGERR